MNAEEKILEDRLINWGRWNQDPKRQGRSPLCAFMEAVPNDEKDNDAPVERHDGPPPVDVSDALLVAEGVGTSSGCAGTLQKGEDGCRCCIRLQRAFHGPEAHPEEVSPHQSP